MTANSNESTSVAHQAVETEINLLRAIYGGQIEWITKNREIVYRSEDGLSTLTLRLPDKYLVSALPEIIVASARKNDLRDRINNVIRQCEVGYEVLDKLIDCFRECIQEIEERPQEHLESSDDSSCAYTAHATVVVWLHHLLNTSKRKQALSPLSKAVTGLTKPGYPGVLIFSGPARDVQEHIHELKALNWQAFQVRLESKVEWTFEHGTGVIEVEDMSDVVAKIEAGNREAFLKAMKIG